MNLNVRLISGNNKDITEMDIHDAPLHGLTCLDIERIFSRQMGLNKITLHFNSQVMEISIDMERHNDASK
jgi:phage gp29-like protein